MKEKILNVALNKITGAWDDDKLAAMFNEMMAMDIDMGATGFDGMTDV